MNGLKYKKPNPQNIFEDRKKQYAIMTQTILDVLSCLGYEIDPEIYTISSDPTNRTFACEIKAKNDTEEVCIRVPIPDNNVAFLMSGNRWIPIYQFCDQPIFKRDQDIILRTAGCSAYIDSELQYIKIGDKRYPIILALFHMFDIPETLGKLNICYYLDEVPNDECICIKTHYNGWINIHKDSVNSNTLSMLSVFDIDSDNLNIYNSNVNTLSECDGTKLIEYWGDSKPIKNLVKLMAIPDFFILENKYFKPPFNSFDLLFHILITNMSVDEIDMNDINNKRIRLGEWLLTKLARQYKQGLVSNKDTLYSNSIMDVLNVDQRRVLDEFVNPLTELSSMSRVIYYGPEGISKESCCSELRNLSESYYGKIDPIDGPSGENIGIAQSIVVETIIENGVLQNVKNS